MAIISESKKKAPSRYRNSQLRYAMTYVLVTFIMLIFLNIYCSGASQNLFNESKKASMIEKCLLTSSEIAKLEVISTNTVAECVSQIDSLKVTRLIVTTPDGEVLYDSQEEDAIYCVFPEVVQAIRGYDVFSSEYHGGVIRSRAATPIVSYGTTVGCVYMMDYDTAQGALIQSLQNTVLRVTILLEGIVLVFSLAYAITFSRRMQKIMASMKIIQDGDYTHKLRMGGTDELAILGREFNDLTERLMTSEQKRRRFVSDASHELKTPLASIKLLTDSILQNDMDMDTVREFVEDIGNEAERLNRMTSKLLSLTRVDGEVPAESEIIYMAPTVRRVIRMLSAIARQNGIILRLELEADSPILILEDDLYQIIFNLIENGIKYNSPGGSLTVRLERNGENAVLHVIDTGMGIPEEALSHIFERFYRVDKARSRKSGGSGLGLSIVKTIVDRNRGEIQVESIVGKGTTFSVSFPTFDTEVDPE